MLRVLSMLSTSLIFSSGRESLYLSASERVLERDSKRLCVCVRERGEREKDTHHGVESPEHGEHLPDLLLQERESVPLCL